MINSTGYRIPIRIYEYRSIGEHTDTAAFKLVTNHNRRFFVLQCTCKSTDAGNRFIEIIPS